MKGMDINMKIMYVAKRGPHNIAAQTHLDVLKSIYGEENIFIIDLLSSKVVHKDRYVSYGYSSKRIVERVIRFSQGNSPFISDKIILDLCKVVRNNSISLLFSEESDLGNLYRTLKCQFENLTIICFFHDISADLFKARINDAPKWKLHYVCECKNIIQQEKVTQQYVDKKWVFNKADAERFYDYYGYIPDEIIPMGAPAPKCKEDYKTDITPKSDKKIILFVCSSYYVNIVGFKWFNSEVLPYLDKKYHIFIVGTGALQLKNIVTNEDVEIVGRVESMTAYYEKADIVIEPVFDGGGMKVKTIEALSFGKNIISTSESLNGYWEALPDNVRNQFVFKCNTADMWIKNCNMLLNSEIRKFNLSVFNAFQKNFSQETLKRRFEDALKKI